MAILRNHSCGHNQRICTRCLSVGCNYSSCPECIGNNSAMVCKCCGSHDVMSMENHQYIKQSNARKAAQSAKEQEQRIKNIEKASNVRYIDTYDNYGSSSSLLSLIPFSSIFTIRNIIISIICYGLSTQFKYSDYDGVIAFVVAIINIIGALIGVVFLLLLQLVDICGF